MNGVSTMAKSFLDASSFPANEIGMKHQNSNAAPTWNSNLLALSQMQTPSPNVFSMLNAINCVTSNGQLETCDAPASTVCLSPSANGPQTTVSEVNSTESETSKISLSDERLSGHPPSNEQGEMVTPCSFRPYSPLRNSLLPPHGMIPTHGSTGLSNLMENSHPCLSGLGFPPSSVEAMMLPGLGPGIPVSAAQHFMKPGPGSNDEYVNDNDSLGDGELP
ncbi:hypothetical protein Ciccas_007553 [Cichlidogyrus casuarinus]|uniref:Uncharacterized protein n=1 Tax=Cichlidogyrus casuarinus TaxID=1844966 RepID=A0ABD2Q3Z0_9PLAT